MESRDKKYDLCYIPKWIDGEPYQKNELLFLSIFKPLKTTIFGLNIVKNEVKQPSIYSKSTNI